jgi:hypothetical protein
MKKQNDYALDLFIDDQALDIEWLEQPSLVLKYHQIQAASRKKVDQLSDELDVLKAQLDREIRSKPESFGIDVKVTEAVVQNTILLDEGYKDLKQDLIDANYEHRMATGAVSAVEHRKPALENLVRLLGQQYYAGPVVPRDLSAEVLKKTNQKKIDSSVGSNLGGRRRNRAKNHG